MRMFGCAILVAVILSSVVVSRPNHNAVLISGNRAPGDTTKGDEFPTIGKPAFNELYFWTDLFLMWELVYDTTIGQFYYYGPEDPDCDHVWVFYGADTTGKDCESESLSTRYDTWTQHHIEDITDYGYYKNDIMMIFDSLAHGSQSLAIDSMTSQDRFFCFVVCHGGEHHIEVEHRADFIWDSTFARAVDQISCKNRAFWLQPCHNGGLLDDLAGSSTVVLAACADTQDAWPCDDIVQWADTMVDSLWAKYVVRGSEKEMHFHVHGTEVDTIYQDHGEFDFHFMNALRGETPTGQLRLADKNGDSLVSIKEVYEHVVDWDSWQYHDYCCTSDVGQVRCLYRYDPQYSDPDSIGDTLFLDGMPPSLAGLEDSCICEDPPMRVVLNWNDNTEPDFVSYKVYRDSALVDSSDTSRYVDTNVTEAVYIYQRTAFDRIGNQESVSDTLSLICGDPNADSRITVADASYLTSFIYQ